MTTDQHKKELEAQKKASAETNAKRLADYNATLATTASNEAKAKFTLTTYQPPTDGLTLEEARNLGDNDLLTALKKQREIAAKSSFLFHRDVAQLVVIYDATVERYSAQGASGAARNGKPTLREAFTVIGWNYDAARTMKRRFELTKDAVPDYQKPDAPPQLTTGELVMVKDKDGVYVVAESVDVTNGRVQVAPKEGDGTTIRVDIGDVTKVKIPCTKIKIGRYYQFEDGVMREYLGKETFVRVNTVKPTKADKRVSSAEAARKELDEIAAGKKKPSTGSKHDSRAARKAPAAATKPKVKVARIRGTQDFGVFPGSCTDYTNGSATTVGTQQICETERDRINAKRVSAVSAA